MSLCFDQNGQALQHSRELDPNGPIWAKFIQQFWDDVVLSSDFWIVMVVKSTGTVLQAFGKALRGICSYESLPVAHSLHWFGMVLDQMATYRSLFKRWAGLSQWEVSTILLAETSLLIPWNRREVSMRFKSFFFIKPGLSLVWLDRLGVHYLLSDATSTFTSHVDIARSVAFVCGALNLTLESSVVLSSSFTLVCSIP